MLLLFTIFRHLMRSQLWSKISSGCLAPIVFVVILIRDKLNDIDFENKSVNTSKHEAEKARIELRFFEILESDDIFVGLADIVMDEDNVPTRRMYSLVNGIKSKSKYKYLNAVCLCFSRDYKMQTALKLLPDA